MNEPLRLLGIDPGSRVSGFGVIEKTGNRLRRVQSGVVDLRKAKSLPDKLNQLYEGLTRVLVETKPKQVAIEKIFHSVNPRSSLLLGHARGVCVLAAAREALEVFEYAPNEVKNAVVGHGKAAKSQVAMMVKVILGLQGQDLIEDEADALAVAICHANSLDLKSYLGQSLAQVRQGRFR